MRSKTKKHLIRRMAALCTVVAVLSVLNVSADTNAWSTATSGAVVEGAGAWNTSTANWVGAGDVHPVWNNANGDTAAFGNGGCRCHHQRRFQGTPGFTKSGDGTLRLTFLGSSFSGDITEQSGGMIKNNNTFNMLGPINLEGGAMISSGGANSGYQAYNAEKQPHLCGCL
jgi:autotransporter-associated beta strand protein